MDEESSNSIKLPYLTTWNAVFGAVLGWSSEDVMNWLNEHYAQFLDDPQDMFYHGDPIYWAANALIPTDIKVKLTNIERIQLEQKILTAFLDEYHDYRVHPNTDLQPFVQRLKHIFSEYG